jgi:hypothetical protein
MTDRPDYELILVKNNRIQAIEHIEQAIALLERESHFLVSGTSKVTILKFSINLAKKILEDASQLFNKETNHEPK